MAKQKPRIRTCVICGKDFITETWRSKYCSYECKIEGAKKREAERLKELKGKHQQGKKLTIEEISALALAEHISYGQWVAKYKK